MPASHDTRGRSQLGEARLARALRARPENGGALQPAAVTQVSGPDLVSLGEPPAAGDWVALVARSRHRP